MRRLSSNAGLTVYACCVAVLPVATVHGAAYTSAGSDNVERDWTVSSTWSLNNGFFPGSDPGADANADTVTINAARIVALESALGKSLGSVTMAAGNANGSPTLRLKAGGSLTSTAALSLVGGSGSNPGSKVEHSGGSATFAGVNFNGKIESPASWGEYHLSGGTLSSSGNLLVSNTTSARFKQSGGQAAFPAFSTTPINSTIELVVSGGTLRLSSVAFNALPVEANVNSTTATASNSYQQSGGTVTIAGGTRVTGSINGSNIGSASFSLSGGTFNGNGGITVGNYGAFSMSGGTLALNGAALSRSGTGSSAEITGGVVRGLSSIFQVTLGGPTLDFEVGGNTTAASTTQVGSNYAFTPSDGAVRFKAYANGSNTKFLLAGVNPTVNLTDPDLEVFMEFDSAYEPVVGDSFSVFALRDPASFPADSGQTFIGSAANVQDTFIDGFGTVVWDTSAYASSGILTVSEIVPIPEPASLSMFTVALALIGKRRRAALA